LQCNEPYTEDNVITILPIKEADKQRLISRGQKLVEQGLTHSLKKAPGSKKRKKHTANGEESSRATTASATNPSTTTSTSTLTSTSTPTISSNTSTSSGIKNAATAMLTARVLEEENSKKKRQKIIGRNENIQSLFTSDADRKKHKDGDFMTRGFSIPAGARRE
jgi:hypothetical protein